MALRAVHTPEEERPFALSICIMPLLRRARGQTAPRSSVRRRLPLISPFLAEVEEIKKECASVF